MFSITKDGFTFELNSYNDIEEFLFIQFPDTVIQVDGVTKTVAEFKTQYQNLQYQRDRIKEYPNIGEQLDMIYHDMENWKNVVLSIKNKYPKI